MIQEQAAELLLTVRDNLPTFGRFHGLSLGRDPPRAPTTCSSEFGLTATPARRCWILSGGFKRRVQVAKIFMVDTPVLFLDEFSTGMDPILKRSVMAPLRDEARGAGRSC